MSDTSEGKAKTIDEFCRRYGHSKTTYYKRKEQGLGPREMRIGSIVRISPSAEADWVRAMENPTPAEAAAIEATREKLRERARTAAAAAVVSPHHVSRKPQKAAQRRQPGSHNASEDGSGNTGR